MAPYQAVILAAGRGSRLGNRTHAIPKALLPIGQRSLLDEEPTCFLRRQCELLSACGVEQIVVVVSYLKEQVIEQLEGWGLDVQVVENTASDIRASGSLHSFQFAAQAGLGILEGTHQTLLLDADIVYHPQVLQALIDAPEQSSMLVCTDFEQGTEEVLVYGSTEQPRFLGKGLYRRNLSLTAGQPCIGEAVGVVKFAPVDHALARGSMDWMLGDPRAAEETAEHKGFGPARQATEHEELTQRFMHYGKMSCVTFGAELPFMEVDSEPEYAHLRQTLYPALLQREASEAAS